MIRARGVSFRYGERTILDGVDLDVRAGEFVGLLGPNGAGKTTLLSVLCGDLDGWQGTVELDRVPLQDIARPDLALRRSVMPQFSEFPFSYLVHDIVMMGRSPHPRGPEDAILVEAAMERTEVTGLADREVTALSGGRTLPGDPCPGIGPGHPLCVSRRAHCCSRHLSSGTHHGDMPGIGCSGMRSGCGDA